MAVLPAKLTFLFNTANSHQSHISSIPTTPKRLRYHRHRHLQLRQINARRLPTPPPPPTASTQVYQPFRPPPTPLPEKYKSLSADDRLELLRNRMGLWYEYAPLVSSLLQEGLTPPAIEEVTGITGVEQNRLAVSVQVRDSLVSSGLEQEVLSYFDNGGSEILYEIRLLSVDLRVSSARYIVKQQLDGKSANQLARAVKDFPRRRGDNGWECFSATSPGDCLAYSYLRLSRETLSEAAKTSALEQAVDVAETEVAKNRILKELKKEEKQDLAENVEPLKVAVPVVRLRYGELTEWTTISVLPVCSSRDGEGKESVTMAPKSRFKGEFGVIEAEEGWKRWIVLPGWQPLLVTKNGVAIEFADAKVLPWKTKHSLQEEAVLVVVDRDRKEVTEESEFYLVGDGTTGLKVERGRKLKDTEEAEVLGTVILVVRPPTYNDDDQSVDED